MNNKIVEIAVEKIMPNLRQRDQFIDPAKVAEIKASILENRNNGTKGLLQVTIVRPAQDNPFTADKDHYEQAFGRHRLLAFKELAKEDPFFETMPVIVREMNDQEMFEAMITENLARREISMFEEAELFQDYMNIYKLNSVQAAPRLGKTEEYIRSRIMLLQLPDSAREGEKKGLVNVTVARDLVTVNKLVGPQGVKEAIAELEELEKGRSIYENPRDMINSFLDDADNLATLDRHAGWFSAKKFPVQYLDRLTQNAVEKLLAIGEDEENEEEEMTPEIKAEIKKLVGYLVAGTSFADEMFPLLAKGHTRQLEQLRILVNPPACESCSQHASFNGDHYCPLLQCKARKEAAWQRKEMDEKVKKLGIQLYQKEDGQVAELNTYDPDDKKLVKSKHADLRLMKAQYMWNNFDGIGPDLKVVAVGATAAKRLQVTKDEQKQKESEQVRRERESRRSEMRRQFLYRFQWEVMSDAFACALDGVTNMALLGQLDDMLDYRDADYPEGVDGGSELVEKALKMKKADGLKMLRRVIMHEAVYRKFNNEWSRHHQNYIVDDKQPITTYAKVVANISGEWGVKLGKSFMTQAEKYQADLDAALKEINKPPKELTPAEKGKLVQKAQKALAGLE